MTSAPREHLPGERLILVGSQSLRFFSEHHPAQASSLRQGPLGRAGWGRGSTSLCSVTGLGVSGSCAACAPFVSGFGQRWVLFLEDADEDNLVLESCVKSADDWHLLSTCCLQAPAALPCLSRRVLSPVILTCGCCLLRLRQDRVPGSVVPRDSVLAPCPFPVASPGSCLTDDFCSRSKCSWGPLDPRRAWREEGKTRGSREQPGPPPPTST